MQYSQNQDLPTESNISIPRSAVRSLVNPGETKKWSSHRTNNNGKRVKSQKTRDQYWTDLAEDLAEFC